MINEKENTTSSSELNKEKSEGIADMIGNVVEKVGHKISEAGAPGLGQKIHDLGDRLEKDHENPQHPHDV